ncbi:hypothetical protein [Steroidobacter denitrificans]|uniref:hypothetical protein n=1 Tax=Steroidobacter denitrificans TaxID=465721 RepID=UPI001AEFD4FD|nr:hypothetical protein [Steroidobacter denitrificans]
MSSDSRGRLRWSQERVPGLAAQQASPWRTRALPSLPAARRRTQGSAVALFLLSDAASYMTGAVVVADGGSVVY